MPNKPKYITELENNMSKQDLAIKEIKKGQDEDQIIKAEILAKLTSIDVCLKGTEYDKENGGLVKEVHKNTACISHMKRNQAKRDGVIGTISAGIASVGTILINWFLNRG